MSTQNHTGYIKQLTCKYYFKTNAKEKWSAIPRMYSSTPTEKDRFFDILDFHNGSSHAKFPMFAHVISSTQCKHIRHFSCLKLDVLQQSHCFYFNQPIINIRMKRIKISINKQETFIR